LCRWAGIGPAGTRCGFIVERLEPHRALALHSTSHLPASWREKHKATLDWSWAFVLNTIDGGQRTRFLFRSRWITAPWWFTLGGWLLIVPADFVMLRDMLRGVKQRAESLAFAGGSVPKLSHTSSRIPMWLGQDRAKRYSRSASFAESYESLISTTWHPGRSSTEAAIEAR
jgi:hypothetical protein